MSDVSEKFRMRSCVSGCLVCDKEGSSKVLKVVRESVVKIA